MRGITYGTTFWETNPDIINSVLKKLTSIGWSELSASTIRWTSTRYGQNSQYVYYGDQGFIGYASFCFEPAASPITIYEF